jgi:acyl-CoA synthetase (AMP-forming)/AMP-acid ligase II
MNHSRHLVSPGMALSGAGGVLHTINPRLFDDQLDYIVNHAEDQRDALRQGLGQPIVERMKPRWTTIEHYICFDSSEAIHFEEWIGPEDGQTEWSDGRRARSLHAVLHQRHHRQPKGVIYEHRSTMLHALSAPSARRCSNRFPLGHAAGRADVPRSQLGLAVGGAAAGAKFVYSAVNDGRRSCAI